MPIAISIKNTNNSHITTTSNSDKYNMDIKKITKVVIMRIVIKTIKDKEMVMKIIKAYQKQKFVKRK